MVDTRLCGKSSTISANSRFAEELGQNRITVTFTSAEFPNFDDKSYNEYEQRSKYTRSWTR
ncbi:hypothetical protein OG533_31670 [Streptomyces sp. NBC_01186]|uniref:hypothetical protein n=1 Tax=unclassified Streptomyces TaxID=2593676 RepID=UPI002DD88DFB|nr:MULTISPECIES: hypothetical protein [unclassified Streptomyces]WSB75777.1 hypothetical protein OHB04_08225 [Streptomyces sp. NBC_01775]WSS15940.1 hypothetical protein OG533_31670 [Streptomyces sp. NBC_01186]